MSKYPQMLYRMPGNDLMTDSGRCAIKVVSDGPEFEAAIKDGWHETSPNAAYAYHNQNKSEDHQAIFRKERAFHKAQGLTQS